MANLACIHRAGCPKPDICGEVGHCTSATRADLDAEKALSSNQRCAFCGEPIDPLAGNPGLWPLVFTHPDASGVTRVHHVKCVQARCFPVETNGELLSKIEQLTQERDASREAFLNACARAVKDSRHAETPAEPSPCEHLRSELLSEKKKSGEPFFQMRKCLDCKLIFRVRSSVKTTTPPDLTYSHCDKHGRLYLKSTGCSLCSSEHQLQHGICEGKT